MAPTDGARIAAVEHNVVEILNKLGQIQGEIGKMQGTLEGYIDSQKVLEIRDEELCDAKHAALMKDLDKHCKNLAAHDKRLAQLEKARVRSTIEWSTRKKMVVWLLALLAYLANMVGAGWVADLLKAATGGG